MTRMEVVMATRYIDASTSDFRNLRSDKAIYVDKTPLVHALLHDGRALFLSRPRVGTVPGSRATHAATRIAECSNDVSSRGSAVPPQANCG